MDQFTKAPPTMRRCCGSSPSRPPCNAHPAPLCVLGDLCGEPSCAVRKGLTLIEVLAVVVILGLIAATLTVSFRGQVGRAKREIAKTGIGVIVNAIETYALETGRLPTMEEGLAVLTQAPAGRGEPYLKRDKLLDPWKNPYLYVTPGPESAYQVLSYGADGQPGGPPGTDNADITSDDLSDMEGSPR